jgi:hypothetical protein
VTPSTTAAFDARRADVSVVRVLALIMKDPNADPVGGGTGTGFVIDREHVATNYHVIHIEDQLAKVPGGQEFITVVEPGPKPGKTWWREGLRAQVIWKSKDLDLAVLKVPGLRRDALTLANVTAADYPPKGAKVFAIGYPGISDQALKSEEGFTTSTLTSGVVGKTVRAAVGGTVRPVIQHDAAINTGNSGGPLFDNCNVVVGVNTFVAMSRLQVMEDDKGNRIATGATATGISLSPHVGNLIEAVRREGALRSLSLRLSDATDCADEPGGIPGWLYGAIGIFAMMAMAGMVIALTRRREVVRVVESYSAWVRRKGVTPGAPRTAGTGHSPAPVPPAGARAGAPISATEMPAPRGRMEPKSDAGTIVALAGDWVLSGFDAQGNTMHVTVTRADLDKAMAGPERGVILGRSSSLSDKIVNDPSVSRRHSKFARSADGGVQIEDLNSAYGTKVNDEALVPFQPRPISIGDKITMGAVTLDLSQMP